MKFAAALFSICIIETVLSFDWCSLNCGPNEHIACRLNGDCRASGACYFVPVDGEALVEIHNEYRQKFATGQEPVAPNIRVANMMGLYWHDDLAFTASCNLAECVAMRHDKCRGITYYPMAGQNLWSASFTGPGTCLDRYKSAVKSWYNEVNQLTEESIREKRGNFALISGTGHFTQVIWAKAEALGCALTEKLEGSMTTCNLACNYGPAGNVRQGEMFVEGSPCSACPENAPCGKVMNHLCGSAQRLDFSLIMKMLLVQMFIIFIRF